MSLPECKHLIKLAAKKLNGAENRAFIAEVAEILCLGSPRLTETAFSIGRQTVEPGMHEKRTGLICYGNYSSQGNPKAEVAQPKLGSGSKLLLIYNVSYDLLSESAVSRLQNGQC